MQASYNLSSDVLNQLKLIPDPIPDSDGHV